MLSTGHTIPAADGFSRQIVPGEIADKKETGPNSEPVPLRNCGEQYPQIFFSLITQPSSLQQMLLLQESLLQGLLQPVHQRPEQQFLQPVLPVVPSQLPEQQSSLSGCGVCCPSWSLS